MEIKLRNIREALKGFNETYERAVKPLILSGDYTKAEFVMRELVGNMECCYEQILYEIHTGGNYFAAAKNLLRKIESGDVRERDILEFEAFVAQSKMPKK